MRGKQGDAVEQQTQTLEEIKARLSSLAHDSQYGLTDASRHSIKSLCGGLTERSLRLAAMSKTNTKVPLTRLRLLNLQLEKIVDHLGCSDLDSESQKSLCHKLHNLLDSHRQRDLYEDMVACLKELSTLSIERGLGHQAVTYNDIAQRLEARLDSGHIDLNNTKQRAQDEALYAEFRQKLESMQS